MKSLRFVIIIILISISQNSFSQTSFNKLKTDSVVINFKQIVTKVKNFFESNPIFLDEQPLSSSPTKRIYQLYKHIAPVKLKYDVLKTSSLISPFSGYIIVEIDKRLVNNEDGYPTLQECLTDSTFDYWHTPGGNKYIVPAKLTYNFSYQNGKWRFIDIIAYRKEIYDDDWQRPENKNWLFLLNENL